MKKVDRNVRKFILTSFTNREVISVRKSIVGLKPTALESHIRTNNPQVHVHLKAAQKKYELKYANVLYLLLNGTVRTTCFNPTCNVETEWVGFDEGYRGYCSSKCSNSDPSKKVKFVDTCLARFGCINPSQNVEVQNKKIATNLKNNGVEFPQQSKEVRRKSVASVKKRYGVTNVSKAPEVKAKRTETMLLRYGSENAMGNEELRHKANINSHASRGHLRYYVKLGKRTVETRGFEPQAIAWLLSNTPVKAKDLFVDTEMLVPRIQYTCRCKKRNYYPDIYVQKFNKIIEVKAVYPLLHSKESWYMLRRKRKAVIEQGFSFLLLVMTKNGERVPFPTNWYALSRKQVKAFIAS